MTLSLYVIKISAFNKVFQKQPMVHKRILGILSKIFILTIFYEMMLLLTMIIITISVIFLLGTIWYGMITMTVYMMVIVSFSYSMHLMMEYNDVQYIKFLRVIYHMKLH